MSPKMGWSLVLVLLTACGEEAVEDDGGGGSGAATSTSTQRASAVTGTGGGAADVPTGPALVDFLEGGEYLGFAAESAAHPSAGPHFGNVRTFVNPTLAESLANGATSHPAGAAAVKELYGNGTEVLGWSVWVKLEEDSAGGAGIYWYELYDGSLYADGPGESLCTGCHSSGVDFYRGTVPLP